MIIVILYIFGYPTRGFAAAATQGPKPGNPPPWYEVRDEPSDSFTDVGKSDWYHPYIEELAERGLALGNPDGTYAPEAPLLVDEFLAFTLRTLGYDLPNGDEYWADTYINKALELRLIRRGEYRAYDAPVTRGQIAAIVVNASDRKSAEFENYADIFTDFGDADDPEAVLKAIGLGVLAGYEDRTFRPGNTATRAEASVIVLRMIDESYRLQIYSGVFFCPKMDLNDDGVMKKEKSGDFIMKAINDMKISISGRGKAIVTGVIPDLPPGHNFIYSIIFFDSKGKILSNHSSNSMHEENLIPPVGNYVLETKADVKSVGHITIRMAVSEGIARSLPRDLQEPACQYVIYNYYCDIDFDGQGFIMNAAGLNRVVYFDFELTRGIWGW